METISVTEYKIIEGNINDFERELNELSLKGWFSSGNIGHRTTDESGQIVYYTLVYKVVDRTK